MRALIFALLILAGCEYHVQKGHKGSNPIFIEKIEDKDLTFAFMKENLFDAKCVRCHNEDGRAFSLETYQSVIENLSGIVSAVQSDEMPPRTPLARDLKEVLIRWVQLGAPEIHEEDEL